MAYIVAIAAVALAASLWWAWRMHTALSDWRFVVDAYSDLVDSDERMLNIDAKQIAHLLNELRSSGHPAYQDVSTKRQRRVR